jgi:energy-coupling factor transporter transmembrane protein EcfT
MMGLVLRFLPLLLDQAREIAAAQRARGVENRKNPLYRLRLATVPLMRRSFQRADELAMAMAARCYSEQGRPLQPRASSRDWCAFAVVAGICLAAVLL